MEWPIRAVFDHLQYALYIVFFFAHCKQSLGRPRNEMHYAVWIFICGVNVDINPEEGQQSALPYQI